MNTRRDEATKRPSDEGVSARQSSVTSSLQRSTAQPLIITIDGPAGTGKSTVAHQLAKRLGLEFLDTGAMYRAAALLAIEQEIDPENEHALAQAVADSGMRFDWTVDPPRLMLGERDVTARIRQMDVSEVVSVVAAQQAVRNVLVEKQRHIAREHPRLVSEGRDQGSVVFPDACVRFFLHADVDVRARRRLAQLSRSGLDVHAEQIVRDIKRRDELDTSRKDGPLIRPQGAVDIDTSDRTIEQVVDAMANVVRREVPEFKDALEKG